MLLGFSFSGIVPTFALRPVNSGNTICSSDGISSRCGRYRNRPDNIDLSLYLGAQVYLDALKTNQARDFTNLTDEGAAKAVLVAAASVQAYPDWTGYARGLWYVGLYRGPIATSNWVFQLTPSGHDAKRHLHH